MSAEKQARDYAVGYGRPPKHTRFRAGNPGSRGRGKVTKNFATLVLSTLNEPVTVNENGRRKTITKLRASLKQLVNKAAAGDARALQLLLGTVRQIERPKASDRAAPMEEADRQVIEGVVARIRMVTSAAEQ